MAHVQRRGDRWLATYKGADGRRHSRRFDRKRDADVWIAEQVVDVRSGKWIDPVAGQVTLGDYARQWVRDRPIRPNTRNSYEANLKHLDSLDGVPLGSLQPSTLRAWQRAVQGRVAPSTAVGVRALLGAVLKSAVGDRLIPASPLDGVPPLPRVRRELVHPMPVADVVELADLIVPNLSAAVYVGAGCGLRRGEVMGLTVDRVNFLRRTVTVDRQLAAGNMTTGPVFGPPKTAASVRTVPLPQLVADALARHLATYEPGPAGLIFTGRTGAFMLPGRFTPVWRDALVKRWMRRVGRSTTRAGYVRAVDRVDYLAAHPDGSDVTFHDLRHFYASSLIADGQSVRVVQARLGHETAAETLGTYAHLWPDDEDRTRAAVDRMFRDDDGDEGAAGVPARV